MRTGASAVAAPRRGVQLHDWPERRSFHTWPMLTERWRWSD